MNNQISGQQIRETVLKVVDERSKLPNEPMNSGSIIRLSVRRLGIEGNRELELALMTYVSDLFRTGYLAWGYNLNNTDPPICHITEQGHRALEHISHDPANPDGYLAYLRAEVTLNSIAESYVVEALKTFNADCYKASAVMIGAASERLVLDIRDTLVDRVKILGRSISKELNSTNISHVIKDIQNNLNSQKMPYGLQQKFEVSWNGLVGQIRMARNDAGHPSSIDPITSERVHALLLMFPEIARLTNELIAWIPTGYI